MEKLDVVRSQIINKLGYQYTWVKEFVYSDLLERDVALAGNTDDDENFILIDVFGEPIKY